MCSFNAYSYFHCNSVNFHVNGLKLLHFLIYNQLIQHKLAEKLHKYWKNSVNFKFTPHSKLLRKKDNSFFHERNNSITNFSVFFCKHLLVFHLKSLLGLDLGILILICFKWRTYKHRILRIKQTHNQSYLFQLIMSILL